MTESSYDNEIGSLNEYSEFRITLVSQQISVKLVTVENMSSLCLYDIGCKGCKMYHG